MAHTLAAVVSSLACVLPGVFGTKGKFDDLYTQVMSKTRVEVCEHNFHQSVTKLGNGHSTTRLHWQKPGALLRVVLDHQRRTPTESIDEKTDCESNAEEFVYECLLEFYATIEPDFGLRIVGDPKNIVDGIRNALTSVGRSKKEVLERLLKNGLELCAENEQDAQTIAMEWKKHVDANPRSNDPVKGNWLDGNTEDELNALSTAYLSEETERPEFKGETTGDQKKHKDPQDPEESGIDIFWKIVLGVFVVALVMCLGYAIYLRREKATRPSISLGASREHVSYMGGPTETCDEAHVGI